MSRERKENDGSGGEKHGELGRKISSSLTGITLEKVSKIGFANSLANADAISEGMSILDLEKTPLMEGENAIVVAAGPSLHRFDAASVIKEKGFGGIVIATDSAMSWCLRNDIHPDLVVTLDPHPDRIVRWFGNPDLNETMLSRDDYFARQDMDPGFQEDQLKTNKELLELINHHGPKIRIAVCSSASASVVRRITDSGMTPFWWNPMYDDYDIPGSLTRKIYDQNGLPCLNAGGNVGSACWVLAHGVLRKRRVGLIGMDFGYYADTPFSRTQYYHEILSLVGPDRMEEVFIRINNPYVETEFYTDPAYLWYRDGLLEMAEEAECETYNCSGGGILFGGAVKWEALSDFIDRCNDPVHSGGEAGRG